MDMSASSRWAPVTGILAPVLWFSGVTVSESGGVPDEDAGAEEILSYFQTETTSLLLGSVLFMLGTLAFVLFVTVLRSRSRALGASSDSTALAFATGIVGAAFIAAIWAPQLGIGIALEDMDAPLQPATAEVAWHIGTGFFVLGELFTALFLFATAAVSMKTAVIPKWLGWIGVALGVVALVPPIGWASIIFGLPLWVLVTAIVMMVKQPAPPAAADRGASV